MDDAVVCLWPVSQLSCKILEGKGHGSHSHLPSPLEAEPETGVGWTGFIEEVHSGSEGGRQEEAREGAEKEEARPQLDPVGALEQELQHS